MVGGAVCDADKERTVCGREVVPVYTAILIEWRIGTCVIRDNREFQTWLTHRIEAGQSP